MVQLFKALTALVEDLGLVLSTHVTVHSNLEHQFRGIQCSGHIRHKAHHWCTCIHLGKTLVQHKIEIAF